VHEHIVTAIIACHKAEALVAIEELYRSGAFADNLCGHLRARATVETAAAATITAAEAAAAITATESTTVAVAATKAATVTVAAEAATTAEAAISKSTTGSVESAAAAVKIRFKIISTSASAASTTLAATAAFPIKTHAFYNNSLVRPASKFGHSPRTDW
jgi:endoglucanase Acf2